MSRDHNWLSRAAVSRWAIVSVLAVILVVTLRPTGDAVAPAFNWCVGCSALGTLDLLYNIALFVPLGALLAFAGRRAIQVLLVSAALSVGIEVLQLVVVPGRDPSLSDVIANAFGGALGVPLARAPEFLRRASPGAWRVVGWVSVALSCAVLALGGWVVAVDVPFSDYYVQWVPVRPSYSPFAGELHAFESNGVPLPPASLISARQFPPAFFAGDIDVRARVTAGPPNEGIAFIARLALEYGEFLMLGRQRNALVLGYRSRAPRIGVRSPIYALPNAFGAASDVLELRALKRRDRVQLLATKPGGDEPLAAREQRVTAARFWATLLPFDYGFGAAGLFVDMCWMAMIVAPAAYAGARSHAGMGRFFTTGAQAIALLLLAVALQPSLWWWPLWLGVALGSLAGLWLGSRSGARISVGVAYGLVGRA